MTKRKEEFIPLEEGKVKMYACGITVSDNAHIGHLFQALVYDIIRKVLKKNGYLFEEILSKLNDKLKKRNLMPPVPKDLMHEHCI